jgi:UDP-N-acetylglucosamine acyltransferase
LNRVSTLSYKHPSISDAQFTSFQFTLQGAEVSKIHPTAVVDTRADIASDVTIGPFCIVEGDVVIDSGCELASRVVIKANTHLGKNNQISEGAVLGGRPQHLRAGQQIGGLRIGAGNMIRENATIHCGLGREDLTVVGDSNLIMVNAHIGHDCHVGNHVILANNVMIAGHVTIEDRVYVSGAAGVHQFCRIGQLAMVGGQSHVSQDVPPFVIVDGISHYVVGLNRVGLRRSGYPEREIADLKAAYRVIYRSGLSWKEMMEQLRTDFPSGAASAYFPFLQSVKRGIVRERRSREQPLLRIHAAEDQPAENQFVRRAG